MRLVEAHSIVRQEHVEELNHEVFVDVDGRVLVASDEPAGPPNVFPDLVKWFNLDFVLTSHEKLTFQDAVPLYLTLCRSDR